jgi:cation diffusion facilitator CzcD-associated flavoprotein CzcO
MEMSMRGHEGPARRRRIAVLGAGPLGLEAALAGIEEGYDVTVYEAAQRPAAHVRDWGHVRLFTPWSMSVSPRMRRYVQEAGLPFDVDSDESPTGHALADRVLDPLWAAQPLSSTIQLNTRVVGIGREGVLKHEEIGAPERGQRAFRVLVRDARGEERVERADIVLDCSGKYGNPNTLGDGGIRAPGEGGLGDRLCSRIPDQLREAADWRGLTVLLAGSGHSAQTAARDLAQLAETHGGTRVLWLLRKTDPDWGAVEEDPLRGRRELTEVAEALASGASPAVETITGGVIDTVERENGGVRVGLRLGDGGSREVRVDRVLGLTGAVGDHTLYRQLQVHECYATSGPMKLSAALLGAASTDCLSQVSHGVDALRNPEPSFFILGDKSYGRNSTFLLRVGWQQVDEVFAELAGGP